MKPPYKTDYDHLNAEEKQHFYQCQQCGEMVDKRQLDDVLFPGAAGVVWQQQIPVTSKTAQTVCVTERITPSKKCQSRRLG